MNAVRRDSPESGGDLPGPLRAEAPAGQGTPGSERATIRTGAGAGAQALRVPVALASLVLLLASLVLLLAVPASSALAQTVQGQLLDRQSSAAVEGALVLLLDEAGATKAGYLTNEAGRFLLRAPGPGTYVLRGERIGYETVTSEPFQLSTGQTLNVRLETAESPILLEELRVEGRQRCVVRPGEGLEVARVWEEARKALTVQDWTVQQGGHHFQVAHWERDLDPGSRLVVSEDRKVSRFLARNPVRSLPVEDLLEKGFVQPDGEDGYVYYGPDAAVLLSDPFLDSYCFRLREDDRNPALVGLSFEPVQGRGPPGIQGTLWLDRETARLQFLQFTYTWAPWAEARGVAEGRVHFEELPGGAWIVRRWWIRMPRMELSSGLRPGGGSALRVVGIREEGSEVIRITSLGRPAVPDAPTGTLSGQVHDSGGARPLAGARVYLAGIGHAAITDSAGHFALEGVPAGLHLAAFTHPLLDSLGAFPSEVEVSVAGGRTTSLDLHAPSRQEILEAHCGEGEWEAGASAVVGRVWSGVEGDPAPGAVVTLEWSRYRSPTGGIEQLQADIKRIEAVTDDGGRFRMCGIPPGVLVTAQATLGGYRSPSRELRVPIAGITMVDLTLGLPGAHPERPVVPTDATAPGEGNDGKCPMPAAATGMGVVEGEVREGSMGVSLGISTVRLMPADSGDAREARSDASGRFAFCDVPAGSWAVEGWLGDYRGGPERLLVTRGERAFLTLDLGFASGEARTGGLRGRVVDGESGDPVGVVELEVVGTRLRTLTGADGRFSFSSLEPGEVRLKVTRLGYAEAEGVVRVAAGEMVEVEVKLATEVIPLDPITVTATRRNLPLWELQGVQRRIQSGWGQFILEEEIRVRSPHRVVDLLVEKGVEVASNGERIWMRRTGCGPVVYLDGQRIARGNSSGESADALRLIHPADLFAVEIYRGPAETPSQYVDTNSRCGVILLWTRRGGD